MDRFWLGAALNGAVDAESGGLATIEGAYISNGEIVNAAYGFREDNDTEASISRQGHDRGRSRKRLARIVQGGSRAWTEASAIIGSTRILASWRRAARSGENIHCSRTALAAAATASPVQYDNRRRTVLPAANCGVSHQVHRRKPDLQLRYMSSRAMALKHNAWKSLFYRQEHFGFTPVKPGMGFQAT